MTFPNRTWTSLLALALPAGCVDGEVPAPAEVAAWEYREIEGNLPLPPGAVAGSCHSRTPFPSEVAAAPADPAPAAEAGGGPAAEAGGSFPGGHFRTPCAEDLTPEVVSTLQRALAARGHYDGPVTGSIDAATRQGIRSYQRAEQRLDSGILSYQAALALGLLAWDRADL